MLNLIRDCAYFDFAYINSAAIGGIVHFFRNQLVNGGALASAYAQDSPAYIANLTRLLEAYEKLNTGK